MVSGSAILRSVDARLSVFLDVAAFYILFGVFLSFCFGFFFVLFFFFFPRYMKICNTCLYHVEKLSDY